MDYNNPIFTDTGAIDCEINHPDLGLIPFTASPDDPEQHGRDLFAKISAAGGVAAYVEPEPLPYVASDLSPRRFKYLLAVTGLEDVWAALENELKETNRESYAQIVAQRSATSFSQVKTLGLVAMFKQTAQHVAPDADLSEAAIKAAWIKAETVAF
jgi:hypothetical protein